MLNKKKVEAFIKAAMKYDGDTYSQPRRLEKGFSDCSSIIQKALTDLGWNSRPKVAVTTHRMGIEGDSRFRQIPMENLERGDILWWHKYVGGKYQGHVGVYLGNGKVLEAIYQGVGVYPRSRLGWQRAYRIAALEEIPAERKKNFFSKGKIGKVRANFLNVRSKPNISGEILGQLKKGQEVELLAETGNWFQINHGGREAYISGAYVDIINKKPIENVPILINGKEIKKGYIINGITFVNIGGKDKPVRKAFEDLGADVRWEDNQVKISL